MTYEDILAVSKKLGIPMLEESDPELFRELSEGTLLVAFSRGTRPQSEQPSATPPETEADPGTRESGSGSSPSPT